MDCQQFTDDMSAYLDGEVSAARATQIETHIEACKACAAELESLRETALFMDSHLRDLEPRSEVWHNVQARINTNPRPALRRFAFPPRYGWAAAAFTVVTAIALVTGIWAYIKYQESERALELYMSDYIQSRHIEEQAHQVPATFNASNPNMVQDEYNPFATVKASFSDPFASEGR